MSASHLTIVPGLAEGDPHAELLGLRVRRLQAEAQELARGHIAVLCAAMAEVSRLAGEIADGGEAYPVGARELCRRLYADIAFQARTLNVITERSAQ